MNKQLIRMQRLAGLITEGEFNEKKLSLNEGLAEGMFSTSFDSEKQRIEDALDRWVKYSMENGDSEGDVMSVGEKYLRDAVMVYIGGTVSDEDLLDKYDNVMGKIK